MNTAKIAAGPVRQQPGPIVIVSAAQQAITAGMYLFCVPKLQWASVLTRSSVPCCLCFRVPLAAPGVPPWRGLPLFAQHL